MLVGESRPRLTAGQFVTLTAFGPPCKPRQGRRFPADAQAAKAVLREAIQIQEHLAAQDALPQKLIEELVDRKAPRDHADAVPPSNPMTGRRGAFGRSPCKRGLGLAASSPVDDALAGAGSEARACRDDLEACQPA